MTKHLDALTLNAWVDGLLAPAERQRVAAHLAECGRCQARVDGQAQVAQLLMRLPRETPPPLLAGAIVAALSRQRRGQRVAVPLTVISTAAALVGLALVALAWPDLARLVPVMAGAAAPSASLTAVFDLPADTLGALANNTLDWASILTSGAGAALMTGLVLLTGAAFAGLAQLLRPAPLSQH